MFSREQYDAAHQNAIVSDGARPGTIAVAGADRKTFLHALLTNDIASLEQGTGVYAAYLTPQGRMVTDMRVLETGDRLIVSVNHDMAPSLARRLDGLVFSEDVQVADLTESLAVVGVHGPQAAASIERVASVRAADLLRDYDNRTADGMVVVRDAAYGVPGFELIVPSERAAALRDALVAAGGVRADAGTCEALRIEAARPRFGTDMTTDTIPLEAGIEQRAISFTKGCYVGQEVIVRVMHRGHGRVARRLITLAVAGAVPSPGDAIMDGERQVGHVTSVAESPRAGMPLVFGYVQRESAQPGAVLSINGSEARVDQAGN